MGCAPARSERGFKYPILIISPVSCSLPRVKKNILNNTSPQMFKDKKEKRYGRRLGTCNYRRKSLSPVQQSDFWGTMPISVLITRLNLFYEEIQKNEGNFQESCEYIQEILNKIGKDFDNDQVRFIKKSEKKFKSFVGKYSSGILLMKSFGFRDLQDCLKLDEYLDESNWKVKIRDFGLACKKIQLN